MSVKSNRSSVSIRLSNGKLIAHLGILYREAAVCSPLVEEGSGMGLGHPQTTRLFETKITIKADVPYYRLTPEEVEASLTFAPIGTTLKRGDIVISQKDPLTEGRVLAIERWTSVMTGEVISEPAIRVIQETSMVHITLEAVEFSKGDAQKFRGYGNFRSNGGFLRDGIEVHTTSGELIFNPALPLYDSEGHVVQAEHVLGAEEFKTLTYVIGLLASDIPGGAVWSEEIGKWENEETLKQLVEQRAEKVTVRRWNLEQSMYAMLKSMYGKDSSFAFRDECNEVIHTGALCWRGTQTQIVETPTTKTFAGKCALFAEHIHCLGIEFPELYRVLLDDVAENQQLISRALEIVSGIIPGATEENPYGSCVVIDRDTVVSYAEAGQKTTIKLADPTEDGTVFCNEIIVAGEFEPDLLRKIDKMLKRNGFSGIVLQGENTHGDLHAVPLDLGVFMLISGSPSNRGMRTMFQLLLHLEHDLEDRGYNNWTGGLYRLIRLLEGEMEFAVADSSSFMAKASKTSKLAFTCRAGSTIDKSVALNELHIHSEQALSWGLEEGDLCVIGRVLVPGMGVLTLKLNDAVPVGTVVLSAATKHAIEEGDCDGDSIIIIAFDREGELRRPGNKIREVNAIA